ncbi:MAG: hypothetical protein HQ481_03730 [Alphaproteobacteria bacterium]|nr:hypothetical protein [Alphaproteobacteria bacterium]
MSAPAPGSAPGPSPSKDAFYVGYLPTPKALVGFLAIVAGAVLGSSAVVAVALVMGQGDWGKASFQFQDGYQTRTGVLQALPYPVLYLPPDAENPDGHAIPLSGQGKRGVIEKSVVLDGKPAEVGGVFLRRGGIAVEMVQVGGQVDLRPATDAAALGGWTGPDTKTLGPRTLKGELVGSKCYLGAMRPGQGKTHKLCANLCIIGGIPPMFVVYRGDGAEPLILLLAAPDGGPVDDGLLLHTAHYVELSGVLERRADLLVFRADPNSLTRL